MKIFITTMAIILLTNNAALSETLLSPSGGQFVLVFESPDRLAYFQKECTGKPDRAYERDCVNAVKKMVSSGAKVSVIDKKLFIKKIRIMSRDFNGLVGWVPMEMVQQ